ncbi:DNA repair protein RecN [Aquifex sp.]
MLGRLYIEKFLFIRGVELEFSAGLNVITGETGTGKSMTLSALEFVAGKQGEYEDGTAVEVEIIKDGEAVILRREVRKGRSRYFLNGRGSAREVVASLLREHVSIQGQNEFINLLREEFQRQLLDKFAGLEEEVETLEELYDEWKEKEKAYKEFLTRKEELLHKKDYYAFRIKEYEEVGLNPRDYEELKKKGEAIKNLEKIKRYLSEVLFNLYEGEGSVYEKLGMALKTLSRLENYGEKFGESAEKLLALKEQVYDIYSSLKEALPELSEEEINEINEKLFKVQRLEEKYGKSFTEIAKEIEEIKELLNSLEDFQDEESLKREVELAKERYYEQALKVSEKRINAAKKLEKKVKELLKELNLERAGLKVDISQGEPTRFGIDRIKFLFSSYGKDFKEIEKTASGGELSRLFLALSLILPATPVYVFDEVDAGISGESSLKLAKFLKKLSKNMQIIAITHSASLCAAGDKNFKTEKEFIGDIPLIKVRELTPEEKLEEVARLMGLKTEKTLEGAKELVRILQD